MKHKISLLLTILLLVSFTLFAQSFDDYFLKRITEHTLDNGLKIIILENHTSPNIAINLLIKAGAADEDETNMGVAHMLEHMLFKGTKTIGTTDWAKEQVIIERIDALMAQLDAMKKQTPPDPDKIAALEKELAQAQSEHKKLIRYGEYESLYTRNGAVGFNASTSYDFTVYTIQLPANKLELWAYLEADRLKNYVLREFYTERMAVLEERRMRVTTNPFGTMYEKFLELAFPGGPYGKPIIGYEDNILRLTKEMADKFFQQHYVPNNMTLSIAGDIAPGYALAIIKAYFGDLRPGAKQVKTAAHKTTFQTAERRKTVYWDAEPQLLIAFHKPAMPARDDYIFDIIDYVLSDSQNSLLHNTLVESGLCLTASSFSSSPGSRFDNLFTIYAVPSPGVSSTEIESRIYALLDSLKDTPLTKKDFTVMLKNFEASFLRSLESNQATSRFLAFYQALTGSWKYILQWRKNIESITPADIQQTAQKYFVPTNRIVVDLKPES